MRTAVALGAIGCLVGCSSSHSSDGGVDGGNPAIESACADEAAAICAQMQACEPFDLQARYGTLDACETRRTLSCLVGGEAPETGWTAALIEGCASAWSTLSCEEFLSGTEPMICEPPAGSLSDGASCVANAQCQSQFCNIVTGALCGQCASQPTQGTGCEETSCGSSLTCDSSTYTCVATSPASGACNAALPCATGLDCVGATTSEEGTCVALGATVGSTCDSTSTTAPKCDSRLGLTCQSHACALGDLVDAGSPCGEIDKAYSFCNDAATCKIPSGTNMGICQAAAADGAACNTSTGPSCFTPARCITSTGTTPNGTTGTCQVPPSNACGG